MESLECAEDGLQCRPEDSRLPGDAGFWYFIAADAVLFSLLFFQFSLDRSSHVALFEHGRQLLLVPIATVNTVVLVSSSWLAATAVRAVHRGDAIKASLTAFGTAGFGAVFVVLKLGEYVHAVRGGHALAGNSFYMYYFVITGLHLAHVVVGAAAMLLMGVLLRDDVELSRRQNQLESLAAYWHLLDVIWLFIFPMLYLAR
jgi:nitric oxide reductase NorE protein